MLTQCIPAHGCKRKALSQCIQNSGLVEITDPTCQSCMLEEFGLDLTKCDVMQVGGQKHYESGVEACGWAGWWQCRLGEQSCVGGHSREASDAVSQNQGWLK